MEVAQVGEGRQTSDVTGCDVNVQGQAQVLLAGQRGQTFSCFQCLRSVSTYDALNKRTRSDTREVFKEL